MYVINAMFAYDEAVLCLFAYLETFALTYLATYILGILSGRQSLYQKGEVFLWMTMQNLSGLCEGSITGLWYNNADYSDGLVHDCSISSALANNGDTAVLH